MDGEDNSNNNNKEKEVVIVKINEADVPRTTKWTPEVRRAALIAAGIISDMGELSYQAHSADTTERNIKNNPVRIVHYLRAKNYIYSKRCDRRLCLLDYDACPARSPEDEINSERVCFLPSEMYRQEKEWFYSLPQIEAGNGKTGIDEDIVDEIIRLRIKSVEGHALLNKLAIYTKKDNEEPMAISGIVAEFVAGEGTTLHNIKTELRRIDKRLIDLGKLVGFDPASREKLKMRIASTQTILQKLQAAHNERMNRIGGADIECETGELIEGEVTECDCDSDGACKGDCNSGDRVCDDVAANKNACE